MLLRGTEEKLMSSHPGSCSPSVSPYLTRLLSMSGLVLVFGALISCYCSMLLKAVEIQILGSR